MRIESYRFSCVVVVSYRISRGVDDLQIANLARFGAGSVLDADLVIIGGGPAGLTIARELFAHDARVLVLESGCSGRMPKSVY
jgi:ribulose 1,5-bisphosphate synthetase/thiazole synthase